jgi:ABC-2 type transport system permease protein
LRREDGAKGGNNMGKLDIRKSFQQKKFRYGGYATLVTAVVLSIVLVLNLVVGQLDLKLDLTKDKLYSLSEQSTSLIKELKSDVKIIKLFTSANENTGVKEIIDKYASGSNKVTIETIDPDLHPEVINKYKKDATEINNGSIVVESGNKFKVIDAYELYNYSTDQSTGQQSVQSLAVEQKITAALLYVTSDKNPVVYNLQGHSEVDVPANITSAFGNENYTVQTLNLLTTDWKPATGDILLINSPQRDFSSEEVTKVKDYLTKGGRALIFVDWLKTDLPNLQSILTAYGVSISRNLILEANASNTIQNYPNYLVPNFGSHDILKPLTTSKVAVLTANAQPIMQEKLKKDTIKVEPLLTTSNKAYAKISSDIKTSEKESGDISGPFNIAVAITDELDYNDTTKNPRIVLFSSTALMNEQLVSMSKNGNVDLVMNSMNWLVDRKDNISIRAKDLSVETLVMTMSQQLTVSGIAVILIPLIVAIGGVIVWLRRRHL